MNIINQNYPIPGSSKGVTIPDYGPSGTPALSMPAFTNPGSGMGVGNGAVGGTMPYMPQDPLVLMAAMVNKPLSPVNPNGTPASAASTWGAIDQSNLVDTTYLNQATGNNSTNVEQEREALAKMHVSKIVTDIIKEIDLNYASGRYADIFKRSLHQFQIDPAYMTVMPLCDRFITKLMEVPARKQTVGRAGAVALGWVLSDMLVKNVPFDGKWLDNQLIVCFCNALLLEMSGWLNGTEEGHTLAPKVRETKYLSDMFDRIEGLEGEFNRFYSYFNLQSPYVNCKLNVGTPSALGADISRFAFTGTAGVDVGRVRETSGYCGSRTVDEEFLYETVRRNAAKYHAMNHTYSTPTEPTSNMYADASRLGFDNNPLREMTKPVNSRTDYENMSISNKDQFNLEGVFKRLEDTNWYSVNYRIWVKISHVWKANKESIAFYPGDSWGPYATFVNIDFDNNERGWKMENIKLKGQQTVEDLLTDPRKLLSELEETAIGTVVIKEVVEEKSNNDYTWSTPIESARELVDIPVAINKTAVLTTDDCEEAELYLNDIYKSNKNSENHKIFGCSIPLVNTVSFKLRNRNEVEDVYNELPLLVKGALVGKIHNYFDWLDLIYSVTQDNYFDPNLGQAIDDFLSNEFRRYLIECRGYGHDDSVGKYIKFDNLSVSRSFIKEWMVDADSDTYQSLTSASRSLTRLIERSQMLMDLHKSREYMSTLSIDPIKQEVYNRTIVLMRSVVLTKVGNLSSPSLNSNQKLVRVKRSRVPEIFSLIEKSYITVSKNIPGSDQLLIFDNDPNSLWTFTTSDFDRRNVATLRRVYRSQQLYYMDFN